MSVEVLEQQPGVSRRTFLRTAAPAVAAVSLLTPSKIATLFAQEEKRKQKERVDPSKLSANDLLQMLPDEIPVKSEYGKAAKVEKYKAQKEIGEEEAKYLLINVQYAHDLSLVERKFGRPSPAEVAKHKKYAEGCQREIGQILSQLHSQFSFRHVGLDGFTAEDVRRTEQALQDARTTSKRREQAAAFLKTNLPFDGFVEVLSKGDMVLLPIETRELLEATDRELAKKLRGEDFDDHALADDRDDEALNILDDRLSDLRVNRAVAVLGAYHHWVNEKVNMPNRVAVWNLRYPFRKFSVAVITPPSVRKFLENDQTSKGSR